MLDRRDARLDFFFGDADDLVGDVFGTIVAEFTSSGAGFGDGLSDFFLFKRGDLAVALAN